MTWLKPLTLPDSVQHSYSEFLQGLEQRLSDPQLDRSVLVRSLLAEVTYGRSFEQLQADAPLAALSLDPRHITLEAEYYAATDPHKFAAVKPLLWLWKGVDLTPLGQNAALALPLRAVLARFIFRRVGEGFKCWQNVEFSVGYNMEVGDNVVVHRHVLLDDIGGIELHDGASISDYVNIYSHTHSVLDSPDVTLKRTIIGRGARVTYHSTVLAGSVISDDAMLASHALLRSDIPPHGIAMGVPARVRLLKDREAAEGYVVDSRHLTPDPPRKANSDFPDPTPTQTRPVQPD